MKTLVIIPAKGNSKRLPKKNIYEVSGKPMIHWAIKACEDSKYDLDVWVNTDSEEIENVVSDYDIVNTHRRSSHLSDPEIFKMEIIRDTTLHVLNKYYEPDIIVSLQANSPEITGKDLDGAIDMLLQHNLNEVFSVDDNMVQNGAFRIMKGSYVMQKDLSTHCGVYVCNLTDVHYKEDLEKVCVG
jgi:CMP-N,N'-diacetyllegionaminic acid synthase